MSEQRVEDRSSEPEPTEPHPTGVAEVDAVVESLSGLDERAVAEHVAVFEQAHESLRRALAHAGETASAGD